MPGASPEPAHAVAPAAHDPAAAATPADGLPPGAPTADARALRRHPAERRMSRATGALLLVMIAQAAFGYALVGLAVAPWVRDVHLGLGLGVLALVGWSAAAARLLPAEGRRTTLLRVLTRLLVALVSVQLALGLMVRGWIPADAAGIRDWHIAIGLIVTLLVVLAHVLSIGPSILLSAAKEYERSRADLEARRPR